MTLPMPSARHRWVATVAVGLAAIIPATALAIPPGGPGENRQGASVTITPKIVAPGGTITIAGSGFVIGQTLSIKFDDGLLLPTTPATGGADVFLSITVDGSGNIPAGTVLDLDDVRAADQPAVHDGSHRVRVLSGAPARSIHADFAVSSLSAGPPENPNGASAFVAPPTSQLLEFPHALDPDLPYSDVPRLVAGSVVPFRFENFTPGQMVVLKRNDGPTNELILPADGSGSGQGYLAFDTTQPGTNWLRFLAGFLDMTTPRSIKAPYAIVPNTDGRDVKVSRQVLASGAVAFTTKSLTRQPVDYVPLPATGQTFRAQIGNVAPITQTADADGVATGTLALPPALAPGPYTALFTIGFAKQNDFPQAVFARSFDVVTELAAATATVTTTSALPGASVAYTLGSFAANAGGGQKVAIYVAGVADPVACVDTDVSGDHTGSFTLPASVPAGTAAVRFVAGSQCVTGGALTQAPAREVAQTLTVVAAAVPPGPAPPAAPPGPPPPPPPVAPQRTPFAVLSSSLRLAKNGTISVRLRPASERVASTVTVRTRDAIKLNERSKNKRVITIAKRSFTSTPGAASRTLSVALTTDGKKLLRRVKSVLVRISVTPKGGRAVTRTVRLSR